MFIKNCLVVVVVCLSVCDALQCTGGVYVKIADKCKLNCGEKEKCLCAKDASPSNITVCQQKCVKDPFGNQSVLVNKCPVMQCNDMNRCDQTCMLGECGMQCNAKNVCTQTCRSESCTKMVCSNAECIQDCKNCRMECTSGVGSCQQHCNGGTCYSVCDAKECHKRCIAPPGEKCEIKVVSSAGDNMSVLWLIKTMLMVLFAIHFTVL